MINSNSQLGMIPSKYTPTGGTKQNSGSSPKAGKTGLRLGRLLGIFAAGFAGWKTYKHFQGKFRSSRSWMAIAAAIVVFILVNIYVTPVLSGLVGSLGVATSSFLPAPSKLAYVTGGGSNNAFVLGSDPVGMSSRLALSY